MENTNPDLAAAEKAAADKAAADKAAADQAAADAAAAAKPKKLVKARVIFAGAFGTVNVVVSLPAGDVKSGEASGELDSSPSAVAYAESLVAK